jgi:hypothetical protein
MKKGQALILLLVFMAIAIIITSGAVIVILLNSSGATKFEQSLEAYTLAEGGAENALIRLLRDPMYTGETLTSSTGQITIVVSGVNPKTVTSTAVVGNFVREISVGAQDTNGVLMVTSWTEIF